MFRFGSNYQWLLIGFLFVGLAGCSKPAPPVEDNHLPQENETVSEVHQTEAYDWKIISKEPIQVGKPVTLVFDLNKKGTGSPFGELSTVHEKLSHLIIVRKDLSYFSHIHPDILGPGKMQVKTEFPTAGEYILYLQFAPSGEEEQTLRQILQIDHQKMAYTRLEPDVGNPKTINGYTFRMTSYPKKVGQASMATLYIEQNKKPVTKIEPYLGAGGHAVLLSEDTEQFLHVHPVSKPIDRYYQSPLQFHTEVSKPGLYRMWIQVQITGKVETVDFTFKVD